MQKVVNIFTYLVIQIAMGFTPMGKVAHKSQTIPYIRPDVTNDEVLSVIDVMRQVMAGEITGVKLVTKKVMIVWDPSMRKEKKEETITEQELLAAEGVQESMSAASAQLQQTQQTPAIVGDVKPAAIHGIDFEGLSGHPITNTEAQPFGAGAMQIHGLKKLNIFSLHDLLHRNPLKGATAEVGYAPPISAADAPLYGLPPLPPGGL